MANILIQPVQIWNNGTTTAANNLEAYSIYDNLENEAKFYYTIKHDLISLVFGNVSIIGDAYIQWLANDFSTLWALENICEQLNLTPILPTN
jgi:hypothetical protein